MTARRAVECCDVELSEYAAGRLTEDRTHDWDRHLVACEVCRRSVAEERRLREALAGGPSMPGDLRLSLLALGRELEPAPAPVGPAPDALRLLTPSAPPCHRSPLRATVVAAAAAGVSAAAAWSLTVIGAPAPRSGVPGPVLPSVANAGSTTRPATGTTASLVSVRWTTRTSAPTAPTREAESTP